MASVNGVQFFFSCITSVMSNPKTSRTNKNDTPTAESYPAISYFVVYRESESCNENKLFSAIHNEDLEAEVTPIRVRKTPNSSSQMETAARQLFQVVKDHNNGTIQDMLNVSNIYCYRNADETSSDDEESEDTEDELHSIHFPSVPCCMLVVNESEFQHRVSAAVTCLKSDGLVVEMADVSILGLENAAFSSNNDVAKLIHEIEKCMKICDHVLYRSEVYTKPEGASFTYVKMMDVSSYLNKLAANEVLRDNIVQHLLTVERILSHSACAIIPQIKFNVDLIEVSNGYCFAIKSRSFIQCPIPESMRGKLSPRCFVPYDCSTPPQPGYFREGILNSFGDDDERARFLNKMYQCLVAFGMPHKVRKLVVVGPKDSGKSSWSNIFHRVIPPSAIASLTNERQFSAAMITNETQIVIVDEWSSTNMQSDVAKCILQGGWMVTAVKHGLPKTVLNNSPYYITTNHLPTFGKDEEENVQRRIAIFQTKSLPQFIPGIDRWIYDHAMDCITWIAQEIAANRHHIDPHELWYEPNNSAPMTIGPNQGERLFNEEQVRRISAADLHEDDAHADQSIQPTIHESFAVEARTRRLARKRRAARGKLNDDSSGENSSPSDDDHQARRRARQAESVPDELNSQPTTTAARKVKDTEERQTPPPNPPSPPSPPSPPNPPNPPNPSNSPSPPNPPNPPSPPNPSNSPNSNDEGPDDEEELPADDIPYTPNDGWVLNDVTYMKRVAAYIKYGLAKATKAELHSFTTRRDRAQLKKTETDKQFWTRADPNIDAWMLLTGRNRDVFDINSFVQLNRDIVTEVQHTRKAVNVLVLTSRCPLNKALQRIERSERAEEEDEQQPQLEVPSQSYWTTFKNWGFW